MGGRRLGGGARPCDIGDGWRARNSKAEWIKCAVGILTGNDDPSRRGRLGQVGLCVVVTMDASVDVEVNSPKKGIGSIPGSSQ